ncbi:MAG: hypothetical protein P8X69_09595, partial [Maritimibacter sp.]
EALQQWRTANADCRKHEILKTVEILMPLLQQNRTKRRRHGDPPFGIDPVYRLREEAVHDAILPVPDLAAGSSNHPAQASHQAATACEKASNDPSPDLFFAIPAKR